jgi:hypothetical protein
MTKAIAYRVLKAKADIPEHLVVQVLAEGWQVQGGVAFVGGGDVCQAIVRVAQEPKAKSGSVWVCVNCLLAGGFHLLLVLGSPTDSILIDLKISSRPRSIFGAGSESAPALRNRART